MQQNIQCYQVELNCHIFETTASLTKVVQKQQ